MKACCYELRKFTRESLFLQQLNGAELHFAICFALLSLLWLPAWIIQEPEDIGRKAFAGVPS